MASYSVPTRLRLWPGFLIVALQWLVTFGSGVIAPATQIQISGMMGGPAVGLLLLFGWWVFASRAPGWDKLLGIVLPIAFLVLAFVGAHPSAPMAIFVYGVPLMCTAFVLWAWLSQGRSAAQRRGALALTMALLCVLGISIRVEGLDGDMAANFAWRWQMTAEERLVAMEASQPLPSTAAPAVVNPLAVDAETDTGTDTATGTDTETNAETGDGTDDGEAGSLEVAAATATTATAMTATATTATDMTASETSAPKEAAQAPGEVRDPASFDTAASPEPVPAPAHPEATWPGFRGPQRDGVVRGVDLAVDWQTTPPLELWRRPIGPSWSSFAIWQGRLYTQEQRGDDELVSAYDAATGQPLWQHRDAVRFWESMAGAGPRATPTVHQGRVYALGATGLLNVLDAVDGSLQWSRNVADDTSAVTPEWGFSSSPLLIDDVVVIYTGGPEGRGVVAYDTVDGEPRWFAEAGSLSYSSVHRSRLAGVEQLLILTDAGVRSYDPADGNVLWHHEWLASGGGRIVQPVLTPDDGILVGTGFGQGLRRLRISHPGSQWQIDTAWTSTALKPYFNDLVLHGEHIFGFDGRILACISLASGERLWKGGRYGNGQLLLLEDQDLLLVLSDRGEVAVVEAKASGFQELAKVAAIEGKTWNHPVIADGVLYVRNAEEMAAFRLPRTSEVAQARR